MMYDGFFTAYQAFCNARVDNPLLETLRLMDLLSNGAFRRLDGRFLARADVDLHRVVQECQKGQPLEYALGRSTFMGLTLASSPAALIPRKETELLVEVVLDDIREREQSGAPVAVIDVGTGGGHVAVALAVYSHHARVLATEISTEALALAAQNVDRFGLQQRIALFCGPLFQPLAGQGFEEQVDIVVGNPPHVQPMPAGHDAVMSEQESFLALATSAYGTNFLRRLIYDALTFLKPRGTLAFQIGPGQEMRARRLVEKTARYGDLRLVRDAAGTGQVLCATRR